MIATRSISMLKATIGRGVQILLALMLLITVLPIWLLIVLLIWCDDGRPFLFAQSRVGLNGSVFTIYKFRSMVKGAEFVSVPDASQALKPRRDVRVTRVGGWLRRFSLDELPQLINVLRGDMALVGPRPHLRSELKNYAPEQQRRLSVKPGMTGLWQVSGRAEKTFAEQMTLDLHYVDHQSIWLDMWIVFKTLPAVVFGRGAY